MKISLNEVRRFQKIAGIISEMELGLKPDQLEEMHVDASGNLISDEEFVKQIVWKHSTSLAKALTALHKRPGYQRAKDFIKQWLENVAKEIGLDPIPSFDDPMFYQGRKPGDILNYVRDTLIGMLKAQSSGEELTEDDYNMGTPSGDTDAMNIAEDGDIDLSDTPGFRSGPKLPWGWEVEAFDEEFDENDPVRAEFVLPEGNNPQDSGTLRVSVHEPVKGEYYIGYWDGYGITQYDTRYNSFKDAVDAAIKKVGEVDDEVSTESPDGWYPDSEGDLL